jgi:hypothetical protein
VRTAKTAETPSKAIDAKINCLEVMGKREGGNAVMKCIV